MDCPKSRSLMRAIDTLYAAAVDPAAWQGFLLAVKHLLNAEHAFLSQLQDRRRLLTYVGLPQLRRVELPVARYEALIQEDPRTPGFCSNVGRAYHCRMATDDARLHSSRAYRDYLWPLDIEYTMLVSVPDGDGIDHYLGLTRGRSGQPFNREDCDLLQEMVPHLARCFQITGVMAHATRPQLLPNLPLRPVADQTTLQRLFGLSPTHARLMMHLMAGGSVKQIADALNVTEGTTRQYLKRIFEKTNARGQADLVRIGYQTLQRQGA
jgi:DNA-binding CsgD family transcriptional regulator